MDNLPWFWIAMIAIVALTIAVNRWLERRTVRPLPPCQYCQSTKLVEIRRNPVGSRQVEPFGGGTPAGGDIRLQIDFDVFYRCEQCGRETIVRISETQ